MAKKKLKHNELYKNTSLVLLITLAGVLFFRLWFGNWIWSYSTDNSDKTFFGLFDATSKSEPVSAEDIIMPKKLILTGGGKRCILEKGTDEFSGCYNSLIDLSDRIGIGSGKAVTASEEEFAAALKSVSVFLDFGSAYGREFLSFVGEESAVSSAQYILLTPGDSVIQKVNAYIKDYATGSIYRLVSEIPSSSLTELIDSHISASSAGNIPFAFELGFDKARQQDETTEISHNILLDSYVTIGLTDEPIDPVSVYIPKLFTEITDKPSASDRIISLFGFSPTSTRRYVEKDDVTTFVNKTGTITFSSDGVIEYTAENEGISVTDGNDGAGTRALGNIYSLIQNIMIDSGVGEIGLHIASDLYGISNQNNSVIYIDYLINGRPVTIVDNGVATHPIAITLNNGKIVSYKHYVYSFRTEGETAFSSSMIKAVDLLYSQFENSADSVTVLDLYKSYVHTVGGDTQILWCAKLKDHSDTAIIRE